MWQLHGWRPCHRATRSRLLACFQGYIPEGTQQTTRLDAWTFETGKRAGSLTVGMRAEGHMVVGLHTGSVRTAGDRPSIAAVGERCKAGTFSNLSEGSSSILTFVGGLGQKAETSRRGVGGGLDRATNSPTTRISLYPCTLQAGRHRHALDQSSNWPVRARAG